MYVPNTIVTIEVVVTKYDWKYRGLLTDASDNTFLNTFLSSLEDPDGARYPLEYSSYIIPAADVRNFDACILGY